MNRLKEFCFLSINCCVWSLALNSKCKENLHTDKVDGAERLNKNVLSLLMIIRFMKEWMISAKVVTS